MRVCLMVEGQEGVSWPQWVELAQACEEHGLDGLFRSDHYFSVSRRAERGSLDAWATLSALAAVTRTIRLGSLVSPVTFRHPSQLAKAVVTADHVSGGRIELGLGAGWFDTEHERYGFPFPPVAERFDMLAEQLEIVHRSWGEEPFSLHGRHYRVTDLDARPKPVQRPRPPLLMGGGARRRSAALAARWADEYNFVMVGPDACAAGRERLAAACRDIGRDPAALRISLMTPFVIGRDRDEVEERGRRLAAVLGVAPSLDAVRERLGTAALIGTVEEVATALEIYRAVGVERVMLQHLLHEDVATVATLADLAARLRA